MSQLRKASVVRRAVALTLLSASLAFIQARRVVQGVAIQYAQKSPTLWALVSATLLLFFLWPLHMLANVLVHR